MFRRKQINLTNNKYKSRAMLTINHLFQRQNVLNLTNSQMSHDWAMCLNAPVQLQKVVEVN